MKHSIKLFLFILALLCNNHIYSEHLIELFLKPFPSVSNQNSAQKLARKLNRPGKIARTNSKHIFPAPVSGIFATYGGFLNVSDLNGEIVFPRRHSKPVIYLVMTEQITPILINNTTIHHWELEEGEPAQMYKLEQQYNTQNNAHFWNVSQEPLPADRIIPLESIVILATPKYVYVPLGISLFTEGPHLILPDIYIKRGINLTNNALYILNLAHFFGPLIPLYKKEPLRYRVHLTT